MLQLITARIALPPIATQPITTQPAPDIAIAKPSPLVEKHRYEMVDVVRFFAAAGVVFVHSIESDVMNRWSFLARFPVSFYVFASLYFQVRSFARDPDKPLLGYALGRLNRLYLPFLVWSCIYLAGRNIKRIALFNGTGVRLTPSLFLSGGDYHLWFLPFILIVSILTACLLKATILRDKRWRWPLIISMSVAGIGFCLLTVPSPLTPDYDHNDFYAMWQWWYAAPSVFLGIAFAIFMATGAKLYRVPGALAACGIMLTAITVGYQTFRHQWVQFPRAMSGLGCLLAALAPWHGPVLHQIARLGQYGYGIYLSHVLVVEITHATLHYTRVPSSAFVDIGTFIISFIVAIAIARTLARTKKLAWMNG